MPYSLAPFAGLGLSEALLALAIAEHEQRTLPVLRRLWDYYRNPSRPPAPLMHGAVRAPAPLRHRLAQECGLPTRITGDGDPARDDRGWKHEAVVENDIGWRLQLMVDFMFGKPVQIASLAPDEERRRVIERVLDAVWERSGGIALLQDMALLGHVYGHVDLLLRAAPGAGAVGSGMQSGRGMQALSPSPASAPGGAGVERLIDAAAESLRVEVVEPTRGIPILDPTDYRAITAYVIHFERELNEVDSGLTRRFTSFWGGREAGGDATRRKRSCFTEILSATHRQVYDDGRLVEQEELAWTGGQVAAPPVVHVQNVSQPFRYPGLSEVEPLIPLQDELNTRLSDRAARVTLQSFKMYLAKGLDGFDRVPVGPGQIWTTDNPKASVEAFGGDAASPSEEAHILELREAMDKTSGVPPLASGVVRAKIGNLTSANALRITLMGVLSRTARKRVTYGRGLAQMSRLILTALDAIGLFRTDPAERAVKLIWPDPLPEDVREQANAATARANLGVPRERILAELGYAPTDPGLT
jgi:hypothetical protein